MATSYESGCAVPNGYYVNPSTWCVTPVARDGARLPDGEGRWLRIPAAAALALVPILGATFLVFLPLVGFLVTLWALASMIVSAAHGSAAALAATVNPGWIPGEAHFTGNAAEDTGVDEERIARDDRLEALAAEIARRRRAAAKS